MLARFKQIQIPTLVIANYKYKNSHFIKNLAIKLPKYIKVNLCKKCESRENLNKLSGDHVVVSTPRHNVHILFYGKVICFSSTRAKKIIKNFLKNDMVGKSALLDIMTYYKTMV